jgi:hypothetical protein
MSFYDLLRIGDEFFRNERIKRCVFEPAAEPYLILSSSGAVAVATSKVFKVQASMA